MKKIIFTFLASLIIAITFAQEIPRQEIENSIIGWMKVYDFKGLEKPLKVDDKVYSANQLSICDSLTRWIQFSYIPKGGLGDVRKSVSEKLGLYNQNNAALPQSYGAYAKIYTELKYNSNHKLEPLTNTHLLWSIIANQSIGTPADALCTPNQYYFTLPSFNEQGYAEETDRIYHLSNHPVIKRYYTFLQRNSAIGNQRTVVLFKDNTSPFIKLTKGAYLQIVEDAVTRLYETEKKKIYENKSNSQKNIDYFMNYLNEKNAKRIECLNNNKRKYKDHLQETAEIFTTQPDAMLENYPDIFEGSGGSRIQLPIYKIDPAIANLCKTDQPQWIVISWTTFINDAIGKDFYESILNNFNFDYVYNFFFNPEKVKGQVYKPLRSPLFNEAVAVNKVSEAGKENSADQNTFFFEDFSVTTIGNNPIGWTSKLNSEGKNCVIASLEGEPGNWVEIKGNSALIPSQLKKPFPQNFTLTYDLIAPQNFTWGGKGLALQLSKETTVGNAESFINLRLRPGSGGGNGEAVIETKFKSPPGYLNGTKWEVAPGFSNNKKNNHIKVTIKKIDETLQIFIDNNKIADYKKAIPLGLLFNAISFTHISSNRENEKYFISNIKITK
jgi:hypothetical protein